MTKLEQAAREVIRQHSMECLSDKAVDALRKALAEQAEQEPVAWMVYTADGQSVYVTDNPTDIKDGQRALPLYTNPVEPISQEPVVDLSKLRHEDKCCYWGDERFCDCGADSHELLKWYRKNAAPVRTKDLTDDEIMKINVDTAGIVPTCDRQFHFARAVIAADREKNK